jgi:hypothetical protein
VRSEGMQFGTLIMLQRTMASANMALWQGWYEKNLVKTMPYK